MPTETSYSHARAHFAALCDEAISTREPIFIHRRGAGDVALIAADEPAAAVGWKPPTHRSPSNALRRLEAIAQARSEDLPAETVNDLRREFNLGEA